MTLNLFRHISIVVLFFLTACIKELPYFGNYDPLPVCNAYISPDQVFTVHLSYNANMMGAVASLDGAKIDVYENGALLEVDFTEENGFYRSDFYPIAGNVYSIDVWKDGAKLFSACDTIPEKVSIENPTWLFPVGMIDEWTQAGLASFTFTDDPNSNNYYEIMLAHESYVGSGSLSKVFSMEINNEFISLNTDRSWLDIHSILFSDSLIQGKTVDIQIISSGGGYVIIFRNVSRSYYQYRKRLPAHQFLQNRERPVDLSFFRGEPIDMFSNINGGLGVFVAYNQNIKECRIIQ